jgi:ferredoxin
MADIIDLELRRADSDLTSLEDPCTRCGQQSFCVNTCQRAKAWWDEFARKFKRNVVINKLGGV